MPERKYRRNLPHVHPPGAAVFITFRLYGSLSAAFVAGARNAQGLTDGERFLRVDQQLDGETRGPLWLRDEPIATETCEAIERGARPPLLHYALHEYVVMPNHVHLLITPRASMSQITKGIKGVTARFGNMQLGRVGNSFWQDESYDRWCRDPIEFGKIRMYIRNNPVKAKLARTADAWPWSSALRMAASGGEGEMARPAAH